MSFQDIYIVCYAWEFLVGGIQAWFADMSFALKNKDEDFLAVATT